MKISRSELRKMILESVLKEQDNQKKPRLIKNLMTKVKGKKKGAPATPAATPAPSAATPAPSAESNGAEGAAPAAPETKKKAPNVKIKQVQRLLNSFLNNNEKIQVDGFWKKNKVDPAMEKVMGSFNIENPKRPWVEMAKDLESKPTLQGLIDFLIKKDNERNNQEINKNEKKPFVSSSIFNQKDEPEQDDIKKYLKYQSSEPINYATSDDINIKLNTALLIGLFGRFPASGAPKSNPNKPWDRYSEEEIKNMRDTILRLKPDLNGKNKKDLAIEFLKNNIDYDEVKERPGDDIKNADWNSLLRKIDKVDKPFDLDDADYRYPEGIQASLKDAVKDALKESKVTYGKSHATLIRERYWGRY